MGYQNFFATRLSGNIGAADTSITLETAPSETSGRLVLEARNPTQKEIIKYTGLAGTTITGVTRGEGGTSAKTHTQNSLVEMNLTAEDIQDLYDAYDSFVASNGNGWIDLVSTPNTVTALGNRSYSMVFNGVDHTDVLSPGMRLKMTRTVTAPTQCADLESGSSHYFNDTSVSGMTFTDDFVVSAWVKLESYTAGVVASRYNGTSGWNLDINATGQFALVGYNAASGNYRAIRSYQSLPLNKWVHVAAQLDMSAYTATTTTCYTMIDGVNVPGELLQAGSNPTALIQAGNLEIGGRNGGLLPFDGKIAQVAIYSAKVTQANVLATISQGLTGSETSLISAYSLSNSLTDLSANANNLTAQNSAVATNADSPFAGGSVGTTEYGIVTAATFSTNTTLTVQVPEGYALPTTGGVSAVSYSINKIPYGFPAQADKWTIRNVYTADYTTTSTSYAQVGGTQITLPIGSWRVRMKTTLRFTLSGATEGQGYVALSTSTSALSDESLMYTIHTPAIASLSGAAYDNLFLERTITTAAATPYYQIFKRTVGLTFIVTSSDNNWSTLEIECAYL